MKPIYLLHGVGAVAFNLKSQEPIRPVSFTQDTYANLLGHETGRHGEGLRDSTLVSQSVYNANEYDLMPLRPTALLGDDTGELPVRLASISNLEQARQELETALPLILPKADSTKWRSVYTIPEPFRHLTDWGQEVIRPQPDMHAISNGHGVTLAWLNSHAVFLRVLLSRKPSSHRTLTIQSLIPYLHIAIQTQRMRVIHTRTCMHTRTHGTHTFCAADQAKYGVHLAAIRTLVAHAIFESVLEHA